jgi:hypothetical protein
MAGAPRPNGLVRALEASRAAGHPGVRRAT